MDDEEFYINCQIILYKLADVRRFLDEFFELAKQVEIE